MKDKELNSHFIFVLLLLISIAIFHNMKIYYEKSELEEVIKSLVPIDYKIINNLTTSKKSTYESMLEKKIVRLTAFNFKTKKILLNEIRNNKINSLVLSFYLGVIVIIVLLRNYGFKSKKNKGSD